MAWQITAANGIHLPQIGWHLDAPFPAPRSFVSHAHADHIAAHATILCSAGTARLMRARIGGDREEIVLPFGAEHRLHDGTRVVLHPAGHIFGSAQWWCENEHGTLLYTGDFKLRPGRSAEPCATPHADTLIMETTFGRPHYVFPPTDDVLAAIVRFCQGAVSDGEVPVLFGYSLGKSQELLSSLAGAGLKVMLHPQVERVTHIYEEFGIAFPPYAAFSLPHVGGHVVICPPQAAQSSWLRRITPRRTAAITGWAMDPGAVYRYQVDATFPLSDHAGYDDLLRFVELVQPTRVLTVHGFAADFARDLRHRGVDAWALGIDNQLELPITVVPGLGRGGLPAAEDDMEGNAMAEPAATPATASDGFRRFAEVAEQVRVAAGKLEKIALLADLLGSLPEADAAAAALFFTGRPFPQASDRKLQLGWSVIKRAVLAVSGRHENDLRAAYHRTGDGGEAAELLLAGRTRPAHWPLVSVPDFFSALAEARGPLAKLELLESRLRTLSALEAKYLLKIITGDLRIGLKEGLVEEAIARASGREIDAVRGANLRSGDITIVARAARHDTLNAVALRVFHPLQCMLASPARDAAEIVARLGDDVWVEEKYDGIRCQLHKLGDRVELYSRDLHVITDQFPEIARAARALRSDLVADGELLAWRDGRALPFLELQRRLGRRGDDFFLGAEVPVSCWLFDLLWLDGRSLLETPLQERRRLLTELDLPAPLAVAPAKRVRGADAIDDAFREARARGNEGLMAKAPTSPYTPGRRGFSWLKLKKAYATLDVVVTAVEYGHGKRRGVLSDYTFSVRDENTGALRTVGKAYSGLTDVEIARLTEHFLETTLEVHGRWRRVEPTVVLEVAFDVIQPSDRHESGYALRFPRIVRIRDDKTVAEIDTVETCRRLATGTFAETTPPSARLEPGIG